MSNQSFIQDLLVEINKFRSRPTSIEKKLETFKLGLSRFKNKQNTEFIAQIEAFGRTLGKLKSMPNFKINEELAESAEKESVNVSSGRKYDRFKSGNSLKDKIPEKYLDQNCLMLCDDGVDVADNFLLKILMDRTDKEKIGRKYLLDPNFKELGIATKPGPDNDYYVVLIFAQNFVEEPSVELPDMDLTELKRAFDLFDVNKILKIDPKETTKAMNAIGFDQKNPELYKIMKELEGKGNLVDFPTFAWHIVGKITDIESQQGLQTIFNLFVDDWEDNTISVFALKKIVKELGEKEAEQEVNKLLNTKGAINMKLNFNEFYEFMTKVYNKKEK